MNRRKILIITGYASMFLVLAAVQNNALAQSSKKEVPGRDKEAVLERLQRRADLLQQRREEAARLRAVREAADPDLAVRHKEARDKAERTMILRIEALNNSKNSRQSVSESAIRAAAEQEARARRAVADQANSQGK